MPKCTIKFAYSRNDKVWISEIEKEGRVVSLWVGDSGIQYNVRFFDKGSPSTVYFYEDELELRNGQKSRKPSFTNEERKN